MTNEEAAQVTSDAVDVVLPDGAVPDGVVPDGAVPETKKPKFTKKKLIIFGSIFVVLLVAAFLIFHKSEFEKVHDECLHIAGQLGVGDDYFSIDTNPYNELPNMGSTLNTLYKKWEPETRERALQGIKYANEALGFSSSLYDRMMKTSAIMGVQREENAKYIVTWTYHPDDGLEVKYIKK